MPNAFSSLEEIFGNETKVYKGYHVFCVILVMW
jgi:hypothetical protein